MSIKAVFTAGVEAITVNGLHQWDYGRKLEIHTPGLPQGAVEVHFACPGMTEAVVRSCAAIGEVIEATIPDRCLEQTSPISAWVYVINDPEGMTVKTITLPVTPRVRPQPGATIPTEVSDRYTELITAVNAAIAALTDGNFTVSNANHAATADNATRAATADNADNASSADIAQQLAFTSAAYDVSDLGSAKATLTPGKRYIISAYSKSTTYDGLLKATMFLFCPELQDGITNGYACSTKSGAGDYVECSYTRSSATLNLYGADGLSYKPRRDGKIHILEF